MSKMLNDRLNPVWHTMLYSCTHMAAVGVRGLILSACEELAIYLLRCFVNSRNTYMIACLLIVPFTVVVVVVCNLVVT